MHIILSIICALVARSDSAPEKWGGAIEFGETGSSDLSVGARILADANRISGSLSSSVAGDLDTHVNGGLYRVAGGNFIGVNGGLHKKVGGSVEAAATGDLSLDSGLSAGTGGSLATDSYAKVGGHANIANGREEQQQIAEYERKNSITDVRGITDSVKSESLLLALLSSIPANFWIYIGLFIGFIAIVTMSCICILCGSYYVMIRELKEIKTVTMGFQQELSNSMIASNPSAKKFHVSTNDWDTNC